MSIYQDAYPLPRATGEKIAETERLDGQHEWFKLALGGITVAPLADNAAKGSAIMRWYDQFREYVGARGVKPDAPLAFTELLQEAGFTVIHDRFLRIYLDPDVAAAKAPNGAQIATELTRDMQRLITNMTEKVFTGEAQRTLAAEALEDLAQDSGRRGYYVLHTHKVA